MIDFEKDANGISEDTEPKIESTLEKISDYEYSMRCVEFTTETSPGEETIVDGVRIIASGPHGFDNADEFRLYLPGRETSDLAECFIYRVHAVELEALDFHAVYNVGGDQVFRE